MFIIWNTIYNAPYPPANGRTFDTREEAVAYARKWFAPQSDKGYLTVKSA